jgi:nucleoid-associated protein YgaU
MPPPVGFVTLRCSDPPTVLTMRLGEDRPNVTAGYGGWDEVQRPRRTAAITWTGTPVRRMDLAVLIDSFAAGTSVEADIAQLERLARPRPGGSPPSLTLDAAGGHIPYRGLTWVADSIAWGDAEMNTAGNRTRQAATLSLVEYATDKLVVERAPANARRAKAKASSGTSNKKGAAVKRKSASRGKSSRSGARALARGARAVSASASVAYEGEDLASIAARELGDATRWREIADLNDIRDPRAIVIGQVLRLP